MISCVNISAVVWKMLRTELLWLNKLMRKFIDIIVENVRLDSKDSGWTFLREMSGMISEKAPPGKKAAQGKSRTAKPATLQRKAPAQKKRTKSRR